MRNFLLLIISFMYIFSSVSEARRINDDMNIGWYSYRDLTNEKYSELFQQYSNSGFMLIDVEAYYMDNELRYAMVWRQNTDQRGWASHRNMTSAEYSEKWEEYRDMGFRPHDIEAYMTGDGLRYAGIWVENKEGFAWASIRNMNESEFLEALRNQSNDNKRMVDFEAYPSGSGLWYAAIFYENVDNIDWGFQYNLTREEYDEHIALRDAAGFWVTDYESYDGADGRRYAAIWTEWPPNRDYHIRTDRTELQYANLWREYRDDGFRLFDFENNDTNDGHRYGGIWIENNHRYRYPLKRPIDAVVDQYRRDNSIAGISVAIIHDGQMVYRKGFGFADIDGGKVAHGQSVYNYASVSKVFGGTLATKMYDEGKLADGTNVHFDITRPTSDYLTTMPSHHTHRIDHLFAHIACIPHYNTTPSIANQTVHYFSATAAVASIWDNPFIDNCTIGDTRFYSTHAFTYAAAVMETSTQRNIVQLVHEEIADRYNLSSIRVQYASPDLPENYERAVPYDGNLQELENEYSNSSWKVLGGGIEGDAVDLARFGWLTLNGNIVNADARDNLMWTPVREGCGNSVTGDCNNGIAWDLGFNNSRRRAQHGGSWPGAGSFLRVYRDDGLSIAILTNRRGAEHPLSTLTTDIADIILSAVSVPEISEGTIPKDFRLRQNYPNPFNPSTTIEFGIPEETYVTLIIYDVLGRKVATLIDEQLSPGWHSRIFDANRLGSGVYLYQLRTDNYVETKRLILLR